ncbi:MAG: YcgN family cysteine cluster protein [Pseudomonadota bacterium]
MTYSAIDRSGLRDRFWETTPLDRMTQKEWEALCDGCGKCCLNKLEDEDTGEVELTRVACRLFDDTTCQCGQYDIRQQFVPECISLNARTIDLHMYWLPATCAYKLLRQGKQLYDWHPLISGSDETVHEARVSVRHMTVPEFEVDEEDWDDHLIEEPSGCV